MTNQKPGRLTTKDIETFETFEKDSFENILRKSIFLYDNYNHIVGCLYDGYIIPILPSSYDYNDLFLKNINMMFYYEIKSSELRNAKEMIFFLENVFLVLKLYNKGPDMAIIKNICSAVAYKPKMCITPNADNKIESLITYTNQVIKCKNTQMKQSEYPSIYSNYEFMRASFFEIERELIDNKNSKNGKYTSEEYKMKTENVNSIEMFEKNRSSLPRLGFYYNRNKIADTLHSITIQYKNHLDEAVTIHLLFNRETTLNNFTTVFLNKIRPHIRDIEIGEIKRESMSGKGYNFMEMYELLVYLWNKSNRKLSLKPVDYYMTDGDLNGEKRVSGFYLENNTIVLIKNKISLTEISKQKIILRKTFNPFKVIQLNEINKSHTTQLPITIQKLHNRTILYELFVREFSKVIQNIDKQGYTKNPRSIPYEIGNIVWIQENGWKIGIIKTRNLKNHLLYDIEYQNEIGKPIIKKNVDVNDIYVSFKTAIFNILNKQIVDINGKMKGLYELFKDSFDSIIKRYFAISDKRLDTYRYKRTQGKLSNITHYNHALCSKHTNRNSCLENPFCKWGNEKDSKLSPYDKFKLILLEEYEYHYKIFILRAYYPLEFNETELPIRFIKDFYGYNQGFEIELLNKYDRRSPEFVKNIVIGYDVIRKASGLKPLFSLKNLLKPEYRKLFKKESIKTTTLSLKTLFETNEHSQNVYKEFIKNILNIYDDSKLIQKNTEISKMDKVTFIYEKDNAYMMRIQENIQNIISKYESIYIQNKLNITQTQTQTQTQTIIQAIKYMWDNKKDASFMEEIQNHKLISMSQNMEKSTCKLQIHIDEFQHFIKKALEQMIREPQRRLQILTNTFNTYNPEEPYIKKEHELIFSNEDINKLLQSDISKYELSQFVNNIRFFDITYSNHTHSKLKDFQISGYNGLDMYNKSINTLPENISKQVTFSFINTTNEDKSYLYRGGNKMTNKRLNELKQKIDMINKRENIRFLDSNTQKDVSYEPL